MGCQDAPWVGFLVKRSVRLVGMVSGWGAARETRQRLSLGEDSAPLNAPSPPPDDRSDQLQSTDGVSSHRRDQPRQLNGVRREKDLNTPAAGLPQGRRD